jgi:short-subunit dehydrogenase
MSYALVTGASSGIGKELAILSAKAGIPLIVTSSDRSHGPLHLLAEELANEYRIEMPASVSLERRCMNTILKSFATWCR